MSGQLRAYVVDDEPGVLKQMVQTLKATGRVDVVGTATSAETALADIRLARSRRSSWTSTCPG